MSPNPELNKRGIRNSEQTCDIFINFIFYVTANRDTNQANVSFPPAGYKKIQHF